MPLLTAMLAHRPQDRPALDDVVRRCRALIEAQGLKVAQARRRLTNFTATPADVLDDLLAVARPVAPGSTVRAHAGVADVPDGRTDAPPGRREPETLATGASQREPGRFPPSPREPEPPRTPPMPPASVPRPSDPRLLFARLDTPTPPPADRTADTTTAGPVDEAVDEAVAKPDRGRPAARPTTRNSAGGGSGARGRSLRHSAQARITARRLREAYAAGSPF